MTNDKFLKLTNTVYKILEFFPESDPLKNRAKDKALVIMEHLILINETSGWASFQKEKIKVQLLEDIDILLGYFWIGKSQGWLNSINYLIIANEYEKIRSTIEPITELTQKLPGINNSFVLQENTVLEEVKELESTQESNDVVLNNTDDKKEQATEYFLSDRHKNILKFLSQNEKAQVMDLQKILPDVTKRTIRRDLDDLMKLGKIIRSGDFNQVFYKINK